MTSSTSAPAGDAGSARAHHLRRMAGRDPGEMHRTATPLELLFDLTFVVAFSFTGNAVAHAFAEGHWLSGLLGFGFALFAVIWAWINYSWFASAFDTDDWLFRVTTAVQMVGVVIFALGIPAMFASLDEGRTLDNRVMVAGYVVMRLAMLAQWLRAARRSAGPLRRTCLIYATTLLVAQLGWVILIVANFTTATTAILVVALVAIELLGPVVGERNAQTPWHADHIAERYSLLAIVALGEGIVGAAVSLSAAIEAAGWDWQTVLVAISGVGLTVAMWWVYFLLPSAEMLERDRHKAFVWGYGHYFVFGAIAAVGAGLHVVGYYLEHQSHISELAAVLTVAIPVGIYVISIVLLTSYLVGRVIPAYLGLAVGSLLVLAVAVGLAALHSQIALSLLVVALAPAVAVGGYEMRGYRPHAAALADGRGTRIS